MQPVWFDIEKENTPDTAVLIVDETSSQSLTNRLAETRQIAEQLTSPPNTTDDIDWEKIIVKDDPNNEGTALFSAIKKAINNISINDLAGIVVLSDGIAHDDALGEGIKGLNVPIHSVIVGDKNLNDRRLIIEKAPQFGLVGKSVDIEFRIDDGDGASRDIVGVRYRLNDGAGSGDQRACRPQRNFTHSARTPRPKHPSFGSRCTQQ